MNVQCGLFFRFDSVHMERAEAKYCDYELFLEHYGFSPHGTCRGKGSMTRYISDRGRIQSTWNVPRQSLISPLISRLAKDSVHMERAEAKTARLYRQTACPGFSPHGTCRGKVWRTDPVLRPVRLQRSCHHDSIQMEYAEVIMRI